MEGSLYLQLASLMVASAVALVAVGAVLLGWAIRRSTSPGDVPRA